jgi:hypothetical protein
MPYMILIVYVIFALLVTAAFTIVGYGINDTIAAASITTQERSSIESEQRSSNNDNTVIQQSSGQSQSSSTSSSVITSESSSGGESTTSSNRIVSRVGDDNLQIDRQSAGKIASSRLNLTNGAVEAVLFGNWSLNDTSGFVANFIYKPSNGTAPIEYNMSGLELHSVNQINDNLVLAGTIDIASNSTTAVLQDVPVTTMIQNGILAIGFGNATQVSDLFGGIPILGFEQ